MQQRYLPHLDGLRAIAVGLVVLYHAGFSAIGAGYIGVDVFFVLSGFLITGQLVKQLDERAFSFKEFYMRRVRRLAPAFIVVAATSLLAGAVILLPDDFIYLARLAALSMLSASNFYLANTTGGYFETDTDEIALLHTWSLAVEEQFYLVWPLFLILLWRMPGYRRHLLMVLGLFVASVAFSVWYTHANATRAYFLLPARFHELLLGALLAMVISRLPSLGRASRELLCWIGLALIVVPAFTWTAEVAFPGIRAVIPCLGTALLVYGGNERSSLNWLLTRRSMIWLGLISYSLYLWHWPIFSLTRYAIGELTLVPAIAGIVLAVLFSHLTWKFVEVPFRFRWTFPPRKTFALLYGVPVLLFAAAAGVIYKGDGFVQRFGDGTLAKIQAMESKPSDFRRDCPQDQSLPCADILLAGDSHAEHYGDFVSVLAEDAGLSLNVMWKPGCPIFPSLYRVYSGGEEIELDKSCAEHSRKAIEQMSRYRYVVFAGYWSVSDFKGDRYFFVSEEHPQTSQANSAAGIAKALRESVRAALASGVTPVILYDNATAPKSDFKCSRMNLLPFHSKECAFPREEMDTQQAVKRQLFRELAGEFPSLNFIDPTRILCDSQLCFTELDGLPLYRDDDHLNQQGSIWLGHAYLKQFGNPFVE